MRPMNYNEDRIIIFNNEGIIEPPWNDSIEYSWARAFYDSLDAAIGQYCQIPGDDTCLLDIWLDAFRGVDTTSMSTPQCEDIFFTMLYNLYPGVTPVVGAKFRRTLLEHLSSINYNIDTVRLMLELSEHCDVRYIASSNMLDNIRLREHVPLYCITKTYMLNTTGHAKIDEDAFEYIYKDIPEGARVLLIDSCPGNLAYAMDALGWRTCQGAYDCFPVIWSSCTKFLNSI